MCPKCGGTDGYYFADRVAWIKYTGFGWDRSGEEMTEMVHIGPATKTVVCMECGKRVPRPTL